MPLFPESESGSEVVVDVNVDVVVVIVVVTVVVAVVAFVVVASGSWMVVVVGGAAAAAASGITGTLCGAIAAGEAIATSLETSMGFFSYKIKTVKKITR